MAYDSKNTIKFASQSPTHGEIGVLRLIFSYFAVHLYKIAWNPITFY